MRPDRSDGLARGQDYILLAAPLVVVLCDVVLVVDVVLCEALPVELLPLELLPAVPLVIALALASSAALVVVDALLALLTVSTALTVAALLLLLLLLVLLLLPQAATAIDETAISAIAIFFMALSLQFNLLRGCRRSGH
jgi:hypothetical protein